MFVGTCVNKVEAIYGRSRFNVNLYSRSTIVFTGGLSYIASILFARVKITRQWKYTLRGSSVVHGTEMTTCPACLKRFLLFIAKCEGRVSNCTKSLFVGRYNSFANRRGLGWVKEVFRFFPHLLCSLKIRLLTCLDLWSLIHQLIFYLVCWCSQVATKTKLFSWDQNFCNYSPTVLSTSTPLKHIV